MLGLRAAILFKICSAVPSAILLSGFFALQCWLSDFELLIFALNSRMLDF